MASKWVKVVDPVTGKSKFVSKADAEVLNRPAVNKDQGPANPDAIVCNECGKEIVGRIIFALDKNYHEDCFACDKCNRQFEMNNLQYTFFKNKAWCKRCVDFYETENGPSGEHVYHHARVGNTEEPTMVSTRVPLGPGPKYGSSANDPQSLASLMTKDGQESKQSPHGTCASCGEAISGVAVGSANEVFHEACFVCGFCGERIDSSGAFKIQNGQPHHTDCAKKASAPPCGFCQQPAFGKCYNVKGIKFHPGCMVCVMCNKDVSAGFVSEGIKLFCGSECKRSFLSDGAPEPAPVQAAPVPAEQGPKFCGECGSPNPGKFCGNCGMATFD